MSHYITTPFGRRTLSAAQIQAQANAAACSSGVTVHKWTVFRDVAAARKQLGLNDRAVAVLDALLTFHPETALTVGEGADLVVYPSNASLALRAHGIAEATLRRSLAVLVEAGLIIRRDSPNGKRYVRREQGGRISQAYGFDLSPLVARAAELGCLAEQVRAAAQAQRVARERVTLLRRDCTKLIVALEGVDAAPGGAGTLRDRYRNIIAQLPRRATTADLEQVAKALEGLAADTSNLLISQHKTAESTCNADHDDRHLQSSKPESSDIERAFEPEKKEIAAQREGRVAHSGLATTRVVYPLRLVIDACPDIAEFARSGIRSWRDLADTANLVRAALGISPDAWRDAQEVMGTDAACVTVAAILQRVDHIKSPGGYLRSLVNRKRAGKFSLGPMLQALHRARPLLVNRGKPNDRALS